jgi:hypothetical protein
MNYEINNNLVTVYCTTIKNNQLAVEIAHY